MPSPSCGGPIVIIETNQNPTQKPDVTSNIVDTNKTFNNYICFKKQTSISIFI